jgi:O-acetyl-ADP-ribose deacetylase
MKGRITVTQGDITTIPVDAIVNAANRYLAGGGGVDGAIPRAAGPSLMRELDIIRTRDGECPRGRAVATTSGNLPARFVFHTVGSGYDDGQSGEPEELRSCYDTCLRMAEEWGLHTISFPAISTGVYGYPVEPATRIAIDAAQSWLNRPDNTIEEIIFVPFDPRTYSIYLALLKPHSN